MVVGVAVADEDVLKGAVGVLLHHLFLSFNAEPAVGALVKYVTRVLGGEEECPGHEHVLKVPVQVFLSEGGEATLGVHDM